jgi:hypothetical protein
MGVSDTGVQAFAPLRVAHMKYPCIAYLALFKSNRA